jgi:hypothetical protein
MHDPRLDRSMMVLGALALLVLAVLATAAGLALFVLLGWAAP